VHGRETDGGVSNRSARENMTYLHFANCMALTFVPPWIVYKSKL